MGSGALEDRVRPLRQRRAQHSYPHTLKSCKTLQAVTSGPFSLAHTCVAFSGPHLTGPQSCWCAVCLYSSSSEIFNAEVLFREDCSPDEFIDVIVGNRVYMPCLYVSGTSSPSHPRHPVGGCLHPRQKTGFCKEQRTQSFFHPHLWPGVPWALLTCLA